MKGLKKIILTALAVAGLSACGGSSGGGNSAADELKAGLYSGNWTSSDGDSGTLAGALSGGEMYAISDDGIVIYLDMSLTGSSVTGIGRLHYSGHNIVKTGTIDGAGTLMGTDITMTLNRSDGITNTVTLTRTATSDDPSSFDLMAGSYKTLAQDTDITISDIGAVSGIGNDGCTYSGDIDIIDASINIYALTFDIANCVEYAGSYTGFASRRTSDGAVSFIYRNQSRLMINTLLK